MAKKTVNSDIYNISQLVDDVKSVFIPEETEETLAIGTYGYIGALEAHRLQTQVQMTGELSNEVFPSRARLERNIITHAIMANIDDINAVPSKMNAFLAIKESDITDYLDENNIFTIDRESPIYIGDYEFHLEYDINLKKIDTTGGKRTYTAKYVIPSGRTVPYSTITSVFLSPPTVVNVAGDYYIYLTVQLSQVHHQNESKKLVTSNIIDNKTTNFEFEDQLAYFEIHCIDSDEDYYLTPVFEGSAVPDGTNYYCWYQYIDVDLIRVRFDRNSYMPTLNTTVECLVKTCKGAEGNFTFNEDTYVTLDSTTYGYQGITCLVTPLSSASGGKDRKSKKELQSLIPKETFSRGSLTTITDLNNYFSMLDSEIGRVTIQKKIDNQIERVYYAYLVNKDSNNNVIPSNTIDLRVGMEDLIKSEITASEATRYLLQSGACIKLGSDGVGYINHEPILEVGEQLNPKAVARGTGVTNKFKASVTDESYGKVCCTATIEGSTTVNLVFPDSKNIQFTESSDTIEVEDYIQMSVGTRYAYSAEYVTSGTNNVISVEDDLLDCFTFKEGYYYTDDIENKTYFNELPVLVDGLEADSKINFVIINMLNEKANDVEDNTIKNHINITEDGTTTRKLFTTFVPSFKQIILTDEQYNDPDFDIEISESTFPETLTEDTKVGYVLRYKSISNTNTPDVVIKFSRGLTYKTGSNKITYEAEGLTYNYEPGEVTLSHDDIGFLYTNPYAVNINAYRLYSAFYMMCINENPYLHFDRVNEASDIQFISTNIYWKRDFYGDDTYKLNISLMQSVQEDIGLIPETGVPAVKAIAVFYRDGVPYRYRSLEIDDWDSSTFTINFSQTFQAKDIFDYDNNIRVEGVQVCGQSEYTVSIAGNDQSYTLANGGSILLSDLLTLLGIILKGEMKDLVVDAPESTVFTFNPILNEDEEVTDYNVISLSDFEDDMTITISDTYETENDEHETVTVVEEHTLTVSCNSSASDEYGFFNPTTEMKIYAYCGLPDITGNYSQEDTSICPGLDNWTLTNIYDVVNGVTFYHNYSEIMGSRVIPYGTQTVIDDETVMNIEGFTIASVPVLGYDYCQDDTLVQEAIDALNNRKAYIEEACTLLENSFGIDFKLYNTYGPSRTYYIIKDNDTNNYLDDSKEYIDRVNITLNFRIRLVASNDSYTKNNIIEEIKAYIEDLDDLGELHIPNLVTQITNNYAEQITYFEYLGFNEYNAEIQHIYKDADDEIPIHTAPEFINVNSLTDNNGNPVPDINIYISEI